MTLDMQHIIDRIPPGWGSYLGVPEEWYPIVHKLDAELAKLDPNYEVHQVKCKFGGLRYYFGSENLSADQRATARALVDHAELQVETLQKQ